MSDLNVKIETMLMEVLQETKTLTGFLHAIFGFLQRHTDFYYVQKNSTDKIGFPKGFRENLVFDAMNYFDSEKELNNFDPPAYTASDCYVPPAVEEVEIDSSAFHEIMEISDDPDKDINQLQQQQMLSSYSSAIQPSKSENIHSKGNLDKSLPSFSPDESKNGAVYENYCWSQTINEIELHIILPENVRSAKQLTIKLEASHIVVQDRLENSKILEGKLWGKCKHHDMLWTMQDGKLNINMDKMQEIWWEKFLIDENAIDPKSIEFERDISELPDEAQAQIHKIRSKEIIDNNNTKSTSNVPDDVMPVNEQMERLRKAWDADDSPFKGQPFDPNMIKLA